MPQQQVVWVKWVDSASENGWVGRADALSQRVVEIYQIGFLIAEDERQITLSATTYVDGGDATCPYHSPVAIPKIAILERGEVNILSTDGPLGRSEPAIGLASHVAIADRRSAGAERAKEERAKFAAYFAAQKVNENTGPTP